MEKGSRWPAGLYEEAMRLWGEGASAVEIGRALGVSRSAVLGQADRHRRDFPMRFKGSPHRRVAPGPRLRTIRAPRVEVPQEEPAPVLVDGWRVTLMTLRVGMCRWPLGDPQSEDFHFCAAPAKGTYCPHHTGRAHARLQGSTLASA